MTAGELKELLEYVREDTDVQIIEYDDHSVEHVVRATVVRITKDAIQLDSEKIEPPKDEG